MGKSPSQKQHCDRMFELACIATAEMNPECEIVMKNTAQCDIVGKHGREVVVKATNNQNTTTTTRIICQKNVLMHKQHWASYTKETAQKDEDDTFNTLVTSNMQLIYKQSKCPVYLAAARDYKGIKVAAKKLIKTTTVDVEPHERHCGGSADLGKTTSTEPQESLQLKTMRTEPSTSFNYPQRSTDLESNPATDSRVTWLPRVTTHSVTRFLPVARLSRSNSDDTNSEDENTPRHAAVYDSVEHDEDVDTSEQEHSERNKHHQVVYSNTNECYDTRGCSKLQNAIQNPHNINKEHPHQIASIERQLTEEEAYFQTMAIKHQQRVRLFKRARLETARNPNVLAHFETKRTCGLATEFTPSFQQRHLTSNKSSHRYSSPTTSTSCHFNTATNQPQLTSHKTPSPTSTTTINRPAQLSTYSTNCTQFQPDSEYITHVISRMPNRTTESILKAMLPPVVRTQPIMSSLTVRDLKIHDLRPYFGKPLAQVSKDLGVCITLMKKICRKNGLQRWPHRRIRSIVNRITSLDVVTDSASEVDQLRFKDQIHILFLELAQIIANPNMVAMHTTSNLSTSAITTVTSNKAKQQELNQDGDGMESTTASSATLDATPTRTVATTDSDDNKCNQDTANNSSNTHSTNEIEVEKDEVLDHNELSTGTTTTTILTRNIMTRSFCNTIPAILDDLESNQVNITIT